jgi:hypothetical protein
VVIAHVLKKENWEGYEAPLFAAASKQIAESNKRAAAPHSAAQTMKKTKGVSKSGSGHAEGKTLNHWFHPK